MPSYALSLGAGFAVGLFYGLIHVRSPAPPLVALVGLLGILAGEQFAPLAGQLLQHVHSHPAAPAWLVRVLDVLTPGVSVSKDRP